MIRMENTCVEVDFTSDSVRLRGVNYDVEIRERVVIVKGASRWDLYTIRGGRRKVVYLWLEGARGYECENGVYEEVTSTVAHVRRISLSIGDYVNVMLAGKFLFDYAILGKDVLVLMLSGKREVYVDKEKDSVAVYVV